MTTSTPKLNVKSHPSDTVWVGIDVSKNELQLHFPVPPKGLPAKIPYDKTSLAKLARHLSGEARFHVVFEATGGYDKPLRQSLHAHGIRCTRANPRHVRNFARSKGLLAKTDRIDAAVLADFGAAIKPAVTPEPDPAREELAALIAYRAHLLDELGRERMQLEHPKPSAITTVIKSRIRTLQAQVERFEKLIATFIAERPALKRAVEALSSVKGIGALSAAGLLAAMPELGTINRGQVAALAGVAPFNRDSGTLKGRRTTYGGRVEVRRAIYMAALSASRHNEILSAAYRGMIARGKPKKVALIAIMRRLLIHLNSIMTKVLKNPAEPEPKHSC